LIDSQLTLQGRAWLDALRRKKHSPRTVATYAAALRNLYRYLHPRDIADAREIKPGHLAAWQQSLRDCTLATQEQFTRIAGYWLRWLVQQGYLFANPVITFREIKSPRQLVRGPSPTGLCDLPVTRKSEARSFEGAARPPDLSALWTLSPDLPSPTTATPPDEAALKSLSDYLQAYLAHERTINHSPYYVRDLRSNERRLLVWLEQMHGLTRPENLTSQHLEAWTRHVSARRTAAGLPLKPNSLIKQYDCDRAFLTWLVRKGALPADFVQVLPRIKLNQRLPTSVLTHRQMMKLLRTANGTTPEANQLLAMLEFLYSSGVRVAELLGLDLSHVDIRNKQAVVLGKGSKERMVAIGVAAAGATETYLKAFRPLMLRDPSLQALWLDRQGGRMPYHTFRRQLLEVAKRAVLPVHVTAHTFRRSFTTELIRNGANLWHVKEALGHESVETLTPYIKLTIPDLKKTLARCHPRERAAR
jgi:site-specific recombinase XerD